MTYLVENINVETNEDTRIFRLGKMLKSNTDSNTKRLTAWQLV